MSQDGDEVSLANSHQAPIESDTTILFPDSTSPLSSSDVIESPMRSQEISSFFEDSGNPTALDINDSDDITVFGGLKSNDAKATAASGAIAGLISGIIVCPLDVAKTRLQAQGVHNAENKYYRGVVGTMSTIIQDEGIKGLYKGLIPIIMGYFPTWMIYFSVYEMSKNYFQPILPRMDFLSNSCSAITAGAVSTILTNPIWVVKTRLMVQSNVSNQPTYYRGTIDAFRKMLNQEGYRSFYAGLVPSLLGLFHVALHFPVYEKLKVKLDCIPKVNTEGSSHEQESGLNMRKLILASSLSKMIASSVTYPHEILRTRLQVRSNYATPEKLYPLAKSIYLQEGIMGFYSGFSANLVRTVPASAVALVSFEYFRDFFQKRKIRSAFN